MRKEADMKILATFDAMDYQDTTEVFEKYSVRGIIMRDGKLAMQCSRDGEYKIPGGGIEPGEAYLQALVREVREETGLHVIVSAVREIGEIVEIRRDLFDALQLTESEIAKGYELRWATPEEIYQRNILIEKDPWIVRDTAFVKMLMDRKIAIANTDEGAGEKWS